MDTIKTASGAEFEVDMVANIPTPPTLYIRIPKRSISEVATIFSDPIETNVIEYGDEKFYGYSIAAIVDEGNAVRVNLRRGE